MYEQIIKIKEEKHLVTMKYEEQMAEAARLKLTLEQGMTEIEKQYKADMDRRFAQKITKTTKTDTSVVDSTLKESQKLMIKKEQEAIYEAEKKTLIEKHKKAIAQLELDCTQYRGEIERLKILIAGFTPKLETVRAELVKMQLEVEKKVKVIEQLNVKM